MGRKSAECGPIFAMEAPRSAMERITARTVSHYNTMAWRSKARGAMKLVLAEGFRLST